MACLYFYQTQSKGQRTLRAVLLGDECQRLLGPGGITQLGSPSTVVPQDNEAGEDFAVLSVNAEETATGLQPGYYRLNGKLSQINETLQSLGK